MAFHFISMEFGKVTDNESLDVAGRFWDSLSGKEKLGVILGIIAAIVAVFLAGYWFGNVGGQNEIAAMRAKHEREITELSKNALMGWALVPPDDASKTEQEWAKSEGVPEFDEATLDDSTLGEFAEKLDEDRKGIEDKTYINQPAPFATYAGKRFDWQGFVSNVFPSNPPHLSLYTYYKLDTEPPPYFSVRCIFHAKHRSALEQLKKSQIVRVAGVMNKRGDLIQCRLLEPDTLDNRSH